MSNEKKVDSGLVFDLIAWAVAIGAFVWVWNFTITELVRSGEEAGVRNKLFEFIWPIVLGFFAGAAAHWGTNSLLTSLFPKDNKTSKHGDSQAPSEQISDKHYEDMSIKELQTMIDHEDMSEEYRQFCKNILKKKKRDKEHHNPSS